MLYPWKQYREFSRSQAVLKVKGRGQLHTASLDQDAGTPSSSTLAATSPDGDQERTEVEGGEPPISVEARQMEERDRDAPNLTLNRKPAPAAEEDPFLVSWEEGEGANPQNWSAKKKWGVTGAVTLVGVVVGIGASIDSAGSSIAADRFGVSVEVMELQTALFLIGFGVSAPVFGPLSELGGRVPVYVVTLGLFSIFEIGSAASQTIVQRLICRFFAGFFGSSPLSNAGGSIADFTNARERTYFFPVFAQAGFSGPVLGPVMGGYLAMNVGQEWTDWLTAILGGAVTIALLFTMPETYAPVLLKFKARQMRLASGDSRFESALERARKGTPFLTHLRHALALPFLYLIYEPIVLFVSLYLTAVYIILFGDFEAFAIVYSETFGFNTGETGLAFIPVFIGLMLTLAAIPLVYRRYRRLQDNVREEKEQMQNTEEVTKESKEMHATVGRAAGLPEPEERLVLVMAGGILIPIAMFYQAWTTDASLPPWPALSAGVLFGAGILSVFISSYQFIMDVYGTGSASALASLTFVRYLASGGAAMFARPMYRSLGPRWAQTVLAFISLAFTAVPWIFYFYGQRIRRWSRYART